MPLNVQHFFVSFFSFFVSIFLAAYFLTGCNVDAVNAIGICGLGFLVVVVVVVVSTVLIFYKIFIRIPVFFSHTLRGFNGGFYPF